MLIEFFLAYSSMSLCSASVTTVDEERFKKLEFRAKPATLSKKKLKCE
jgi:hypothetical protein